MQFLKGKLKFLKENQDYLNHFYISNRTNVVMDDLSSIFKILDDNIYNHDMADYTSDLKGLYGANKKLKFVKMPRIVIVDDKLKEATAEYVKIDSTIGKVYDHYKKSEKNALFIIMPENFEYDHSYKRSNINLKKHENRVEVSFIHAQNGIVDYGTLAHFNKCIYIFYSQIDLYFFDTLTSCRISAAPVSIKDSKCDEYIKLNFEKPRECSIDEISLQFNIKKYKNSWTCKNIIFKAKKGKEPIDITLNCNNIYAPYSYSYTCSKLVYPFKHNNNNYSLVIKYLQVFLINFI